MNQQIFRRQKCSGIEIERRVIRVNDRLQIQLYPQTVELLYIDREILQTYKFTSSNLIQDKQTRISMGKISVNFSETETVLDLKDKIKKIIQNLTPKIQQIRIYCFQNSLFQLIDFNRYLEYYLLKEDIKQAEMDQRRFYESINNRANDDFLVEFFPGKLLTDQSVKYLCQNRIKQLIVEGYISNKWVFPEQPLFSISKNCQFCSMISHLYLQFQCMECKNVLMFCSRVCEYQSLKKHPCQSAKKKRKTLYREQDLNIAQQFQPKIKSIEQILNTSEARHKQKKRRRPKQVTNQMKMFKHGKGLHNLGNTCYMNSGIQIISSTALTQIILNHKSSKSSYLPSAYIKLIKLFKQQNENQYLPFEDMQKFKTVIDAMMPNFSGYDQHDAQEFITVFLDQLHNQIKTRPVRGRKQSINWQADQNNTNEEEMGRLEWLKFIENGLSPVINLFYGQMKNQIKCLSCESISRQFNSFNTLQVSMPSHSQQNVITLFYEFYQFRKQTTLITLTCGNRKLGDLLNKVKRVIKAQGDQNKRNLKIFLLGFEQTFYQYQETVKVKDLVGLIGPANDPQRQLFIFQPPLEFNVYIIAKFLNEQKRPFTFKRPLFFNTPTNNITNRMLYQTVSEYFMSFLHIHDRVNQVWTTSKIGNYFKLRLQWKTQIDQTTKRRFYGQGKLIEMDDEVSPELSLHKCEVWIELQKFSSSEDSLGLNFYKLLTTKFIKYVKVEISQKDKLNLDDQYLRLQDCIEEQFSKKQYLELQNQVFCPICNQKRDIQKSAHPYKISRYLIIHLKRFKTGADGLAYEKDTDKIVVPLLLNLENVLQNPMLPQKYYADLTPPQLKNLGLDNFSPDASESYNFKLKGVILHQGNIEQGHYFAFAESNDGSWWKYNDEQVSMIDIRQQLNLSLNMEKIYIMMYERTTP